MQNRKARMNDAKIKLDQCVTMWCNNALDGVKVFYFLCMTWRVDICELMEEFSRGNFAKRALLGWTFAFLVIV